MKIHDVDQVCDMYITVTVPPMMSLCLGTNPLIKALTSSGLNLYNIEDVSPEKPQIWSRGCSSVVERVLRMYEVLGSIPSISNLKRFLGAVFIFGCINIVTEASPQKPVLLYLNRSINIKQEKTVVFAELKQKSEIPIPGVEPGPSG